ncbi:hypothetical protein ANN_21028 [Periplaneta americana]|uniref:Uncharacterized protein n=1 Tax=Periplaneta americana TaxID=6978 RepID=A0ABQ8SEW4_PERAM|nr:hypothetical protein ANN_21028 [Periplaneta americana]
MQLTACPKPLFSSPTFSEISFVISASKYLGVTFQITGTTFSLHAEEKAIAATRAINNIRHLQDISVEAAMKLFHARIIPILTYGVDVVWEYLRKRDLKAGEKVKATYLKRVLGVSKFTPSRLVYVLIREPFLIEDLRYSLILPTTDAYKQLLEENTQKRNNIDDEFYATSAMVDRSWTGTDHRLRNFYNLVIFYNDEVRSEDSPKDYPAFAFWLEKTSEKPNQEPGGSLPPSHKPAIGPYPEQD